MLAQVESAAVLGVDAYLVRVEADVSSSFASFSLVGLPDTAVRESGERVRAAIRNSGFVFPLRRIVVNLAPADTRKQGPLYDLPIALGVLLGDEQVKQNHLGSYVAVGELGLDGQVRPVAGVLPMVLGARAEGREACLVPAQNAAEAAVVDGIAIYPVASLADAVQLLQQGGREPIPHRIPEEVIRTGTDEVDWADVKGQGTVKRALEVAAAGGHNCLMLGSPGAGKTLLARRLPTILPPLLLEESLEVTKLHSVAGLLPPGRSLVTARPFRSPHHTVSHAGLVGGGSNPRPGEISLAHHGVLFLDELPEFHRDVLEVMRQPMEEGSVTISRAALSLTFPARFQLVAAMNPCPCGYHGDTRRKCTCLPQQRQRYLLRISGPLLDRIDIHVEVPRLTPHEMMSHAEGDSSCVVRERVCRARAIQVERLQGSGLTCNAQIRPRQLKTWCALDEATQEILKNAINQFSMSARAHDRILKVARTIADLEASPCIQMHHVAEAINYRTLDRKYLV